MSDKIITLSSQEDLKIFMSPTRQRLLRHMHINGSPMTAKSVSDVLGVSPSSAKHHITKLEKLGLIEQSHTKLINGIKARYYKPSDVSVSLGMIEDDLSSERNIIIENLIKNSLDGLRALKNADIPPNKLKNNGDFLNGVVHLSAADAESLMQTIRHFIVTHESRGEDTLPWEYSLILYNAGLAK